MSKSIVAVSALLELTSIAIEASLQAQRIAQIVQRAQIDGRDINADDWAEIDKDRSRAKARLQDAINHAR